jgi:arylsulfatase A
MSRIGPLSLAAAFVGVIPAAAVAADAPKRPNVVLILADDLGLGHVGCFGQTKVPTPHIDRLAAEGMRFTNFYSGACVCAPARSTLMTGQHTGHTPVRNNGLDRYLSDADVTLAEVFKAAGYATGGFGKWGLGRDGTPGVAVKQGFDAWFGQYSQVHAHFHYPAFLMDGLDRRPLPGNLGMKRGEYAPDVIHAKALEFITANKDRPFFAYLPYTLTHVELVAPPDYRKRFEGRWPKVSKADRPGYIGSDDAHADFAGMIARLDDQVGEVMAKLKELGIDDNTVVMFTSDNGPQPGPWADVFVEFFDGNGPYRGAKTNFYEGGIREPTVVRWPGRVAAGTTTDFVGHFPDVMPTLAELAGVGDKVPSDVDGLSFAPMLLGRGDQKRHPYLYWEAAGTKQDTVMQAVRWGNWKAVRPRAAAGWELYDLAADPGEAKDVAAGHPDVLAKVDAICREAHTPERKFGPGPQESAVDYVK